MRYRLLGTLCLLFSAPALAEEAAETKPPEFSAEQVQFYETQVAPLLKQHCLKCHGGEEKIKGEFNLTTRGGLLQGGESGPAIDLEDPAASMLLEAVNYEGYKMPPDGKLPAEQIALLTKWVEQGAPYPKDKLGPAKTTEHNPLADIDAHKSHWSFQPLKRPAVPAVKNQPWVSSPMDAFILAKLEQAGLEPVGPAEKSALLRRAYYDLTGLPPTPEEVRAFLADESPEAYEKVLDRLLESPHYGEKWGRHWLDLVRYGETNSFERDNPKPFVWRYRDYVIQSLNADKPYDQFLMEQLAGDELDEVTPESIIATGYYRIGIWDDEPADPELARYDELDDIVGVTSQVMLGLTVHCARCHDHKLDPIPQEDYYSMVAFFQNIRRFGVRSDQSVEEASIRLVSTEESRREHPERVRLHQQRVAEVGKLVEAVENRIKATLVGVEVDDFQYTDRREEIIKKRVPQQLKEEEFRRYIGLRRELKNLQENPPQALAKALAVKESGPNAPETHLLVRGNPHVHGKALQPAFPRVLSPPQPQIEPTQPGDETSNRRLALAKWIASADNPLTARVMANRLWHYHFGRGIVRSTSDFGLQGTGPTHPELLDWLASELIDQGWRLKAMHKLIMLSSAYRLSSAEHPVAYGKDPENNLFWRYNMRRLQAEEIRDSLLAANGTLNLKKMYGPPMYPLIPQAVLAGQSMPGANWGRSSPEERNRRSIYIHIKRSLTVPLLANYDVPESDLTCPTRFSTTQPTQALSMLNSDYIHEQAREFAGYLRREAGDQPEQQVRLALWRVTQREPAAGEVQRGLDLMQSLQEAEGVKAEDALTCFCLVALNLNEFIYLD